MQRRDFLRWLGKATGGLFFAGLVSGAPPLKRINTTLFSPEANASVKLPGSCVCEGCDNDVCVVTDTCTGKDYCSSVDACNVDVCVDDYCDIDKCNSDYHSEGCGTDICVLDVSASHCGSDLCREDRTSGCSTSDTCSLDNCTSGDICIAELCAPETDISPLTSRRDFAKAGINRALKMLYRLCTILLFVGLMYGRSHAAVAIDATNAVFQPEPAFYTDQPLAIPSTSGPFISNCNGFLRADTDCDGCDSGDPVLSDYNNDGSLELPVPSDFPGPCNFTEFNIPSNVAIDITSPVNVTAVDGVSIHGAVRLHDNANFYSIGPVDLRTSAWLDDGGDISFYTAQDGIVIQTQTSFPPEGPVFLGISVPAMTGWGVIIFVILAGFGSVYYIRRRRA